MPILVRVYVRTALVHLALALGLALLLVLPLQPPLAGLISGLRPVQVHLLTVGWLTQLIFGVALWMFPRYSKAQPRGPEWLAWGVWGLLNGGLLLRAIGEPLRATAATQTPTFEFASGLLAAAAVLFLLAGWGFVGLTWSRVRER